jgi:membrane protease YdiL (CAAX protease family)
MNTYLELAQQGKNDWWRYALSLPFIIVTWFLIGSVPIVLMATLVALDNNPATQIIATGFIGIDPTLNFLVTITTFIPFFLATLIALPLFHGRAPRTLVTPLAHINWGRFFISFGVWIILGALISLIESLLYPGRYVLTFDAARFIPIVIAVIIFIPIQTSAEELFFRGYLIQGLGLHIKQPMVLSLLSGLLFMLPHFSNPEMKANFLLVALFYFSFGAFAAWITLKDQRLELALGMHAANNIYASLFANYTDSALPTQAIFTINYLDPIYNLVAPIIGFIVYYIVIFHVFKSQEQA